jgi:two-component system, NarL family, sensor kinase
VLLSTILFLLFINQKRKSRIAKQQELLYQQQIRDLEQQKQLDAARAMVEGQEQERERLARDLHDGLGGLIAGTKMFLSNLATKSTDPVQQEQLNSSIDRIDHTLQELRQISRNMMPQSLLRYGLKTALKDLCESLELSGAKITFQENGLKNDMASATQITIYRVIQELLTNALKHARAKQVLVQVLQHESAVHITIEDDGQGFEQQQETKVIGMGLLNVKNRVAFLKGKLDISSKPMIGTTVTIELMVA